MRVQRLGEAVVCGGFALACLLFATSLSSAQITEEAKASPGAPLSLDQVVQKLEDRNVSRATALQEFEGERTYRLQYRGFPSDRDAEMVVKVAFHAPNSKQFTVISQSGSKFIIDHVFKKLLESEQEAARADSRQQTALTRENYQFQLAGYENSRNGSSYVLQLIPKTKNKFLYRGKIWIDANDFAVVRIEAEPGKNPSMWIKKTEILHTYSKLGDFWMPAENRTVSSLRLGGTATLSIEYQNYKITKAVRVARKSSRVGDSSLLDGRLASVSPAP